MKKYLPRGISAGAVGPLNPSVGIAKSSLHTVMGTHLSRAKWDSFCVEECPHVKYCHHAMRLILPGAEFRGSKHRNDSLLAIFSS